MQWTADNTPSTIQSKSLKLRELFAKVANASLAKGFSEQESIFAGTNAVKIEERKNQPEKVKAPKLPSHVESLRSYSNPFEVVSKAEIPVSSDIKTAEFDKDGRLVLSMSDGKKITSKNTIVEKNIEQNIAIAPNVQLLSSDNSVSITQDGQVFDLSATGGGGGGGGGNFGGGITSVTATAPINSTGGANPVISIRAASTTVSGSMSAADKVKLDGISSGAQVNAVDSVAGKTGVVTLVKADVGLSNADNTTDSTKSVASASTLTTSRLINGVSFDGSADITIADSTKQPLDDDLTAIAALTGTSGLLKKTATDTWTLDTNNYVTSSGVTSVSATGSVSGLTLSGTVTTTGDLTLGGQLEVLPSDFQSQSANLVLASPNSASGEPTFRSLVASDIPSLDASKITSGIIDAARLPSYVDDVVEFANLASFPSTGETAKLYVALDTNKVYRWSGSTYIFITSGAVDSVAGKTGVVTLNNSDVGLNNVENKSSSTIRSEITSTNVTTALGFTPYDSTNPNGYITGSGNTTGTASNITGTVAVANAGTGITSYAAGDILYAFNSNTLSKLPIGSAGDVLTVDNTGKPDWVANSNSNTNSYSNQYTLTGSTTDATETEIFIGGVSNSRIGITNNTFIYYTIDIVSKGTGSTTDLAAFYLKGAAVNRSTVVSDAGSLYEVVVTRSDANILVDVRADNTNKTLNIYVTGVSGKSFSWKAIVTTVEI